MTNKVDDTSSEGIPENTTSVELLAEGVYSGNWIDDVYAFKTSNNGQFPKPVCRVLKEPGYSSLSTAKKEFRFLKLYPGEGTMPLTGELLHCSLGKFRPEYIATSYSWADSHGNATLSEEIFISSRHQN
jgi:hypothetical protein